MKSLVFENTRLEYTSALGDSFLLMQDWVTNNLSEAELAIYHSDGFGPEKQAIWQKWIDDQQITDIKFYVDEVLQS